MPSKLIFGANISKTDDQIFHAVNKGRVLKKNPAFLKAGFNEFNINATISIVLLRSLCP